MLFGWIFSTVHPSTKCFASTGIKLPQRFGFADCPTICRESTGINRCRSLSTHRSVFAEFCAAIKKEVSNKGSRINPCIDAALHVCVCVRVCACAACVCVFCVGFWDHYSHRVLILTVLTPFDGSVLVASPVLINAFPELPSTRSPRETKRRWVLSI